MARHPVWLWIFNFAVLITLAGWIVWDAQFTETWNHLEYEIGLLDDPSQLEQYARHFSLRGRIWALGAMVTAAVASGTLMLLGIALGNRGHRGLLSWLVAISLLCSWLGLVTSWDHLIWLGRQLRLDGHVAAYQSVAEALHHHWPQQDGESPELGPFMAYPGHQPKVLILLTTPPVARNGPSFSSVERSDAGGLRFQLSGNERGTWLEWHPEGHQPVSFVGGLQEPHDLKRAVPLGDGWYLARYEQAALTS